MERLIANNARVEVRVDKTHAKGGFDVRVLSAPERCHAKGMVDVHLSPAQEQAKYEELQKFCKAEFRSLAPVELETLLKKIVVYKDKKDKAFLRGIVEKIRNTSIFIRELDTRTMRVTTPLADIRLLPKEFNLTDWPPKILHFQLDRIIPLTLSLDTDLPVNEDSDKLDAAAVNFIKNSIKDKIIVCNVQDMDTLTGCYKVMIFLQKNKTDKPVNLNLELINQGYARQAQLDEAPCSSPRPVGQSVAARSPSRSPSRHSSPAPRKPGPLPGITTGDLTIPSPEQRRSEAVTSSSRPPGVTSSSRPPGVTSSSRPPSFKPSLSVRSAGVGRRLGGGGASSTVDSTKPLILGCDDLAPVSNILDCDFRPYLRDQYIRGRGDSHTNLSMVQQYGWPFFKTGRDGVLVFHPDGTLRTELTFIIPLLDIVSSGVYSRLPRSYSPKVLIVVPSCKDVDQLVDYSIETLLETTKMQYSVFVRKVYTLSKTGPRPDLWNSQDIIVITPDSLLKAYKDHIPPDGRIKYFQSTCHVVLHKAHDLFTHHKDSMMKFLNCLQYERSEQEYDHKCQLVLFSDIWLPVFHPVIRKFMNDPVIMLQNRTEAALFSGVKTHVEMFRNDVTKLASLITTTRKLCELEKKVVIVVEADDKQIVEALKCKAVPCYMITELRSWATSGGSCIVIQDDKSGSVKITDSDVVIHYDVPKTLENFNNRLSFLSDHFQGLLSAEGCYSIFLLTDDDDNKYINNLVKYLKRYNLEIPADLNERAELGEKAKQETKINKPLCPYIRQYGSCTHMGCPNRHVVLVADAPGSSLKVRDIPLKGKIQVKITSVADGNRFYGRILSVEPGKIPNAEEEFQVFHDKVQKFFTTQTSPIDEDKIQSDLKKEGKNVIVGIKCKSDGLYYRAKVSEVRYNADRAGKFDGVVAQLLDTGRTGTFPFEEVVRFPARLAEIPPFSTEMIVCGIKPTENDRHFASDCMGRLNNRIVGEVLEGNIELALGNCLWVKTLEKRLFLKNLKLMSSELSVKKLISDNSFGVSNPEHIKLLRAAVREALPDEVPPEEADILTSRVTLSRDQQHRVAVSHINTPHDFYVNVVEGFEGLASMEEEVNNTQLLDSILPCWLPKNSLCIARYSKDNRWYRGEIRRVWVDRYHVHFVDYGNEDESVPSNLVKPIPPHLLQLPFQAVHCKLAEIEPVTSVWGPGDQQVMSEVTDGEDFYLDLVEPSSEDAKYTVILSYVDDEASLVDILCREPVGMNISQIKSSSLSQHLITLYRGTDDYEILCVAEKLQNQIASPSAQVTLSDLVTLCRLVKIRLSDEDSLVHIINSITNLIKHLKDAKTEGWAQVIIHEDILGGVIDKLSCVTVTHTAIANLLAAVSTDPYVVHMGIPEKCIVSLCELCVYKDIQTDKLVAVLGAISSLVSVQKVEGLTINSATLIKEILATGHLRTLTKFLRDSSDACLEHILRLLGKLFENSEQGKKALRVFKDERGLEEVCRATKRTKSPAVIDVVKFFTNDQESLTLMKKEGLAAWFKSLKERRRDLNTRIACDRFCKTLLSHKIEDENKENTDPEVPVPLPLFRVPLTTPIDQPVTGVDLSTITREPGVHWHQKKKQVFLSVQLKDVGSYELRLQQNVLEFSSWNSGTLWKFRYFLFDGVSEHTSTRNSSEVLITLTKQTPGVKWDSLLANGAKKATIKLDFSRVDDSDEELDSDVEEEPYVPLLPPPTEETEIYIGEAPSSDEYVTEEEEVGDDFSHSVWSNLRSKEFDEMDDLE